jgi:hypothetical protein
MTRLNVDEVDVHAVDLRLELRESVQSRLALAPIVAGSPVANEFLELRQLRALRLICDRFLVGPARGLKPAAKLGELFLRETDGEGAD